MAAIGALLALLAGCSAASPTTTYINDAGESITVDWADFPAYSSTDTELVLAGPSVEETEERAEALFTAIRTELDREFSTTGWSVLGDDEWHPADGNGYGGQSMLSLYNSAVWESPTVIPQDQWPSAVSAVERVADEWGLSSTSATDLDLDLDENSGWMRSGSLHRGVEWLDVSIQDARLDDEALQDAERLGWMVHGVSLSYGINTLEEADREEFERRAAPFVGLDHPDPTTSD